METEKFGPDFGFAELSSRFEEEQAKKVYEVGEFIADFNWEMREAWGEVEIEGEVGSFKVNQGKWVFFDLRDAECSLNCFMVLSALRVAIEDGMRVRVVGTPKLTDWGKFSLVVKRIKLAGEGDLKKSFELLKQKLAKEGLFLSERKQEIPEELKRIGVISSMDSAGYADFIKILNARWGGMEILVAHTAVQGEMAPDQMIRALKYLNEQVKVDLIVMVRGGGSADDLACFNDELLVRAVADSKTPVITGIGHEIDESLVDLAADVVGSTPSNVAELISKDREFEKRQIKQSVAELRRKIETELARLHERVMIKKEVLLSVDPEKVLARGYAIVRGEVLVGKELELTTVDKIIKAEIKDVKNR